MSRKKDDLIEVLKDHYHKRVEARLKGRPIPLITAKEWETKLEPIFEKGELTL